MIYYICMRKTRVAIYNSRKHLLITLGVVALPFVFLLWFSHFSGIATEKLFSDIGISFIRLTIAYIASVVIAWILAISFYHGKRSAVALPLFDVLQSFPTFAILPLSLSVKVIPP